MIGSEVNQKKDIKSLFQEIQQVVVELIQYLNKLYNSYSLAHSADNFYQTLIRMFSPFEVLISERINIATIYGFQSRNKLNVQKSKDKVMKKQDHHKFLAQDKNQQRVLLNSYTQATKLVPDFENNSTYFGRRKQNITRKGKRIGRPPALAEDMEKGLCKWIKSEHQAGRQVTKYNIVKKAQEFSKQQKFNASLGWVDKLLRRNPTIKLMVTNSKNTVNLSNLKVTSNFYKQNDEDSDQQAILRMNRQRERKNGKIIQYNNNGINRISKSEQIDIDSSSNRMSQQYQDEYDDYDYDQEAEEYRQSNISSKGAQSFLNYRYSQYGNQEQD